MFIGQYIQFDKSRPSLRISFFLNKHAISQTGQEWGSCASLMPSLTSMLDRTIPPHPAALTAPAPMRLYLCIHATTSSIVPEAISVEVMTLAENTVEGDGKEQGG